jgi:hypothetical protein
MPVPVGRSSPRCKYGRQGTTAHSAVSGMPVGDDEPRSLFSQEPNFLTVDGPDSPHSLSWAAATAIVIASTTGALKRPERVESGLKRRHHGLRRLEYHQEEKDMDQRRRGAVFAASGAIIAASSLLLLGGSASVQHADFWRGFAVGLALLLMAAAVILIMRSRGKSVA